MTDISVNSLANQIMNKYDRDNNGEVNVKTENVSTKYGTWGTESYTRGDLFRDVDVHTNHDGIVTKQELQNYIKTYDVNGDNKLEKRSFWDWVFRKPKGELEQFESDYKENKAVTKSIYDDPFNKPSRTRYDYPRYDYSRPKYPDYDYGYDKNPVYSDPFDKPSYGDRKDPIYENPFDKPSYGNGDKKNSVYDNPFD